MAQDEEGVLYVLTDAGLVTYDGTHWEVIHPDKKLPTSWSSHLTQLPNGSLLAVGQGEEEFSMHILQGDTILKVECDSVLKEMGNTFASYQIVQRPATDKKSEDSFLVLITNKYGSHLWDASRQAWNHLPNPTALRNEPLGMMYWGDSLIMRTYQGLYTWQAGSWVHFEMGGGLPSQKVIKWQSIPHSDLEILIGRDWVGLWKNDSLLHEWSLQDSTFSIDTDITFAQDGRVFFTSEFNYYVLNLNSLSVQSFATNNSDAVPRKARIHTDHEGNLWIGTHRGLFKINSFRFLNYLQKSGLVEAEGTAILELPDHVMMLGHNRGFSWVQNQRVIRTQQVTDTKNARAGRARFHSYARLPSSLEWKVAGGSLGLGTLNTQGALTWNYRPPNTDVLGVAHLGDTLLVLQLNQLEYRVKGRVVKEFSFGDFYRQVKVVEQERVILLGREGVSEIVGDSLVNYYPQKPRASSNFYDLEEIKGNFYLASAMGLFQWAGDSIFPAKLYEFNERRPIYDILLTSKQQVWLGTNDGVYVLEAERAPTHYSFEDGLAGTEVNRNSLVEDSQGHIWIGTNQGVSEYTPEFDMDHTLIPRTSLVSITEGNHPLPIEADLQLSPQQNTLTFQYRGLSYYNEGQINYRIRLYGFDTAWIPLNHSITQKTYTNLPPGVSYRFEVQSRLGQGQWSEPITSGFLYIKQPFTATVWFTALMICLAISIGVFLRFLYSRELNRRWLTQEVTTKTQEIAQSEEELRAQNENLLKINRELDRFVYSASHDLSAPLKSIRGLLHIAKLDKQAGQLQQEQYLAMIDKSVNQLEKFIGELIDFSRNSRLEPTFVEVNLFQLVPALLENLQFMDHFHRVQFSFDWGEGAETILADEFRLKVILNNLLTNAVKFQRLDVEKAWVIVSSRKTAEGWEIEVADDGQGIEEALQPKIFDMFFRANEGSSGSGLGLYIAQEAAQRMGGRISLISELHAGTTFTVFIPHQ